jgi:hypothetical protein
MKFTYTSGQSPLDGYTIKRGIGQGGFGEVYYALSDGGKEVALKLVRANLEIELRGMAQCLNLKHPNLLTLFDLKTDAQGDHWVVMEYIAGEPLSAVLNRHPRGLAPELARQWFLALTRAVACLHDHGIVHRDLKPGNIFLENGTVKVGDYGLCKFISSSQRTAQTQSVGTVHYMAPEVSTGNYNKQIDVYAAGIILYEMLTGHVPFDGESAGEILMKHLTAAPDLTKLPKVYSGIVGQALAKDPAKRYANMAELAGAVEMLSAEARVEARPVEAVAAVPESKVPEPATVVAETTPRGHLAELCGSMSLTTLFALVASSLWAALFHLQDPLEVAASFFLTVATCWAVLVPAKLRTGRADDAWLRVVMLVLGMAIGIGVAWLEGRPFSWPITDPFGAASPAASAAEARGLPALAGSVCYFGLALFALRWWRMADRQRTQRFGFGPLLAAGFWGLVLLPVWPHPWNGTVVLVTSAAIVQIVSPWEKPAPPNARRLRLRCA